MDVRFARSYVDQEAAELFDEGIQLLVLELHPPGPRDPAGIHGVIWEEITAQPFNLPADRPLTLAAYEVDLSVRAYVHTLAVSRRWRTVIMCDSTSKCE